MFTALWLSVPYKAYVTFFAIEAKSLKTAVAD